MFSYQSRQGDVFIVSDDAPLPANLTEVERVNGKCILAYGEKTGHSHAIADEGVLLYMPEGVSNVMILDVQGEQGATLVHDEHFAATIPQGKYKVYIQTEYTPDNIRAVLD